MKEHDRLSGSRIDVADLAIENFDAPSRVIVDGADLFGCHDETLRVSEKTRLRTRRSFRNSSSPPLSRREARASWQGLSALAAARESLLCARAGERGHSRR